MRYPLSKFGSIPQRPLRKLSNIGINDTDQLLRLAALPKDRQVLSERTGISMEDLAHWAGMADLVRVKGIGPSTAEQLVLSGAVGNVQSFVTAMNDPGMVLKKIKDRAPKKRPTRSTLISSAEEAAELRPKILLKTSAADDSFRDHVFSREKEERRHSRRLSYSIIGIMVLAVGLLYGLSQLYLSQAIKGKIIPGDVLNQYSVEIYRILVNLSGSSLLVIIGILMMFLVGLYAFYDWLTHLENTWLILWLFDHPQHREFYWKIKSIDLKKQVRRLWLAVGLFALLAMVLVVYAFFLIQNRVETGTFTRSLTPPVIIGGVLIGFAASLPVLEFLQKKFSGNSGLRSVHRYMIFHLSKVLTLPLMVMILTRIVMPVAFDLHRNIYLNHLLPPAREHLLEKRREIMSLDLKDISDVSLRDKLLNVLDTEVLATLDTFGTVVSENDNSFVDFYIPAVLHMVVWTALTALFLLFVVPYLILGGWKRGLFYILILGIGLNMEDILKAYSPTWFNLPKASLSALLMASFFIFANALFFDWLFDELTDKNTFCLSCGISLSQESYYCSHCGFARS